MEGLCELILALSERPDTVAMAALAIGCLLLLLGEGRWHPLLLWPVCAALAVLAGGPPLCEMALLRIAIGFFAVLILMSVRGERPAPGWRPFLGSLAARAAVTGVAAIAAFSLAEAVAPPMENVRIWQALAGCGTLGAAHCMISRTARGVAAGTAMMLLAAEASLWLLQPNLLVLAGCGGMVLLTALGGALHQGTLPAPQTAEKTA